MKRPHNTIADRLGASIIAGELEPGVVFDGEEEASVRFGVSRGAYREAIRTLAAKGLVQSRPRTGTKVLPRERWNLLDLDVLGWLFQREPDEQLLRDLFGLRLVVETAAAGLAATLWTEEGLAPLREAIDTMIVSPNSSEAWCRADKDFHDTIFRLAGNAFLGSLSAAIGTAVRLSNEYKLRAPVAPGDATIDHLRVYEAIMARDAELAILRTRTLVEVGLEATLRERNRGLEEQAKAGKRSAA